MSETLSHYGGAALVLTLAGAVVGLLRVYIAHSTRLRVEREASARAVARGTVLVGLAGTHHDAIRIVESDRDGHREVELGRREGAA
jgi:hypothetical protein